MNRELSMLLAASVAACFLAPVQAQDKREPKYEGKPLAYWVNRLQSCEKSEEQSAAEQALIAFEKDAIPAVPKLVEMLDDRSESFRETVGRILCRIGPGAKSAIPELIRSLKDKTARSPEVVICILGAIGPDAREAVPEIIAAIELRPATCGVNDSAVVALCSMGPAARPGIAAIRRLVYENRNQKGKSGAFYGTWFFLHDLPKLGDPGTALLTEFLADSDETLQRDCAEYLGLSGPNAKSAAASLEKLLVHQNPFVRLEAATALWKIEKNESVIAVLTKLVQQGEYAFSAASVLGDIGPLAKVALPELVNAYRAIQNDQPPVVEQYLSFIDKIDPAEAKKLRASKKPAGTSMIVH